MILTEDGAQLFAAALLPFLDELKAAVDLLPGDGPGLRLNGVSSLEPFLSVSGCIGAVAGQLLGEQARPVRAILFDKSEAANWSLGWHQDRTICVKERREVPGFEPWTVKAGMQHVAPPADLLSRMITVRAHLDDVPSANAPLLIAPGSHRFGRIGEERIDEIVEQCGIHACLASAGDVWAYSTPILHASEVAAEPIRRRVLQVDYAAEPLPGGLEWLGV